MKSTFFSSHSPKTSAKWEQIKNLLAIILFYIGIHCFLTLFIWNCPKKKYKKAKQYFLKCNYEWLITTQKKPLHFWEFKHLFNIEIWLEYVYPHWLEITTQQSKYAEQRWKTCYSIPTTTFLFPFLCTIGRSFPGYEEGWGYNP